MVGLPRFGNGELIEIFLPGLSLVIVETHHPGGRRAGPVRGEIEGRAPNIGCFP